MFYIGICYMKVKVGIVYTRHAVKALKRIPRDRKDAILAKIAALAAGARADVVPLTGQPGYRLRVGRYRVIFRRAGDTIEIIDIDVRGSVY